ncbi:MAG: hypothetical protein ABSG51_10990 [Terracidiphilus sp.]
MKWADLIPGYEKVFTVMEYYDGPRQGIAHFNGSPYFYDCIFDEKKQDYSNQYQLTQISQEIFDLAIEDWAIWKRWDSAFHAGKVNIKSHPALPEDKARHEEVKAVLDVALKTNSDACIIRIGTFAKETDSKLPKGVLSPLLVKWEEPAPESVLFGLNSIRHR